MLYWTTHHSFILSMEQLKCHFFCGEELPMSLLLVQDQRLDLVFPLSWINALIKTLKNV